ncbi:SoxR reducing system RseC family protein [Methylomagnum sp.]
MIEEEAVVARVDEAGTVWVEKSRQSACASCDKGCPSATVGDYFGDSTVSLPATSAIDVNAGDRVVVGVSEGAFLKGSLGLYLLPLLGMFAGSILGNAIGPSLFAIPADAAAIIGGLLGLMGTLALLKFTPVLPRHQLRPVVLRKLS